MTNAKDPFSLHLPISGMSCAACGLERVLNRLPGVEANVNFASERARVRLQGKAARCRMWSRRYIKLVLTS